MLTGSNAREENTNPPGISSGDLHGREKRNRTICSVYLPPTDLVTEEDMRGPLEQLL